MGFNQICKVISSPLSSRCCWSEAPPQPRLTQQGLPQGNLPRGQPPAPPLAPALPQFPRLRSGRSRGGEWPRSCWSRRPGNPWMRIQQKARASGSPRWGDSGVPRPPWHPQNGCPLCREEKPSWVLECQAGTELGVTRPQLLGMGCPRGSPAGTPRTWSHVVPPGAAAEQSPRALPSAEAVRTCKSLRVAAAPR